MAELNEPEVFTRADLSAGAAALRGLADSLASNGGDPSGGSLIGPIGLRDVADEMEARARAKPTHSDSAGGPDSLGNRIRALKTLEPSVLGALGATADHLTRRREDAEERAEAAEAMAGTLEWVPAPAWVVQALDGSTWHEASEEAEARDHMRPGDTLLRLYVARVPTQYRVVVDPPAPADDGERNTFAHG